MEEKYITITGETKEELDKALELYFLMFVGKRGFVSYKLFDKTTRSEFKAQQEECAYEKPIPELHFYAHKYDNEDENTFPCEMHKDTLVNFIWEWLQTQEIDYTIDTDGSHERGWTIVGCENLWMYEDNPSIVVTFTTMIYGK